MKKLIFTCCLAMAIAGITNAQDYKSSVGLRLGLQPAASYKQFISESKAFEGYLGSRGYRRGYRELAVGASLQFHEPIDQLNGLKWYWGVGPALYVYYYENSFVGTKGDGSIAVQGYLGLDYKFDDIPLNLSLDWVPTIKFGGFVSGFGGYIGGLTARYILDN